MRRLLVFVSLVQIFLAACAGPASPEIEQPAPTATAAPATATAAQPALPTSSADLAELAGVYTISLTQEQLLAAGVPQMLAIGSQGTWQLTLTADGMAQIAQVTDIGVRARAEGPYSLSPSELFFGPDTGDYACSGFGVGQGSYRWSLAGDQLTLEMLEDECEDRSVLFVAGALTRIE
jgi:hypothetical protein